MTLTQKINSNPYLKVSNCTDIADLEAAMDDLRKLDAEFGEASASNMHPIFQQALKQFRIR